jgi:hypothetical protein
MLGTRDAIFLLTVSAAFANQEVGSGHFADFQWDTCGLLTLRAVGCGILRSNLWDLIVGSIDGASIVLPTCQLWA